jgi:hypothetical protein
MARKATIWFRISGGKWLDLMYGIYLQLSKMLLIHKLPRIIFEIAVIDKCVRSLKRSLNFTFRKKLIET